MRTLSILFGAMTLIAACVAPASAPATTHQYFGGNPFVDSKHEASSHHHITRNDVYQNVVRDGCEVAAGARDDNHDLYGSYNHADGHAWHSYSGDHWLYAVAWFVECYDTGTGVETY